MEYVEAVEILSSVYYCHGFASVWGHVEQIESGLTAEEFDFFRKIADEFLREKNSRASTRLIGGLLVSEREELLKKLKERRIN